MKTNRAYKFRIYPRGAQVEVLAKTFGCVRFVYNRWLARRTEVYRASGQGLGYTANSGELTQLKQDPGFVWLQEVAAVPLQQALRDLDSAFARFFKKQAKYPKFKKKFDKQSFRLNEGDVKFDWERGRIQLPKMGWLRMVVHHPVNGSIRNITISKTKSGLYFASINVEVDVQPPTDKPEREIGIDLGLKDFAVTSEGERFAPPNYLRESEKKIKRLQRTLSRRTAKGKNWIKAKNRLAKAHAKVAAQRTNFLHQLSTHLAKDCSYIALESLNVQGMLKNHHLAKSIADASWSEFSHQLAYKGAWYACHITKIDPFAPSSKTCSTCGSINPTLTLNQRSWICPNCNTKLDRDLNAAVNILNLSRGRLNPKVTPAETL